MPVSMVKRQNRTPFQKEWDALCRREQNLLERRQKKKETALNRFLAQKVPEKLQGMLDKAFGKAFSLIFEKGTKVLEKTYNRDKMQKEYQVDLYADQVYGSRKSLRVFSKKAKKAEGVNLALSGISGIGMGIFGIGLPDIPLFTGMILKCVYEMALHYGFDYRTEKEKYFVLLLIEGAVSYGEHLEAVDKKIEAYIQEEELPPDWKLKEQIESASRMLSGELLYMKFLQGIPIAGVIGGAYDLIYMKQIGEYADLKYHKRFLLHVSKQREKGEEPGEKAAGLKE